MRTFMYMLNTQKKSASDVGRPCDVHSAAVPLAATQDTSGSERQLPCPVLQPLAQPQVTFSFHAP